MNNTAIIVKINSIRSHPAADRLIIIDLFGTQVITSPDVKEGDLMIYFDSNLKLSQEYLKANNLYRNAELNSDTTKTGYFEDNGRVKCVKLRGELSDGLLMPLESVKYAIPNGTLWAAGSEFNDLFGRPICEKYIPKPTKEKGLPSEHNARTRKEIPMFPQHYDTDQFFRSQHIIAPGLIWLIEKTHGCVKSDTIINTLEFGNLTIKEILDKKLNCKILAFDTMSQEKVYVPISDYFYKENDGEWYEIELEDGTVLTITGDNLVWLPELNCYRKTSELAKEDTLLKL